MSAGTRGAGTVAVLATALLAGCAPDRPTSPALARGIDAVFADLDRPGSPGASVAVIQGGDIIYSRGYGYAQIEHAVPVTPATVFHVASVSSSTSTSSPPSITPPPSAS